MKIGKSRCLKQLLLCTFLAASAVPAVAGCIDLTKGNSFSLKRIDPRFEVVNTVSRNGSVTEQRVMMRNGATENVTTTYWNGVIAVDRKSSSSHIQLKMSADAMSVNLTKVGQNYKFPVSILVNGNKIDDGSLNLETMAKTNLTLDGCNYPVMVVRINIERNNGAPINEEALLSLDAGMLLGNVAMTADWQAKHGVFYDEIRAN